MTTLSKHDEAIVQQIVAVRDSNEENKWSKIKTLLQSLEDETEKHRWLAVCREKET